MVVGRLIGVGLLAPEADEREDVWLDRAALAARSGPLGHHTHWGGVAGTVIGCSSYRLLTR
jgi:hypothetical protein